MNKSKLNSVALAYSRLKSRECANAFIQEMLTFRDIAWNIDGVIVIHKTYPPTAVTYNTIYSYYREEENDSMSFAKYAKQNDGTISIHEYYANAEEALIAAADAFREVICSESGEAYIYDIRNFLRDSFLGATNWVENIPF